VQFFFDTTGLPVQYIGVIMGRKQNNTAGERRRIVGKRKLFFDDLVVDETGKIEKNIRDKLQQCDALRDNMDQSDASISMSPEPKRRCYKYASGNDNTPQRARRVVQKLFDEQPAITNTQFVGYAEAERVFDAQTAVDPETVMRLVDFSAPPPSPLGVNPLGVLPYHSPSNSNRFFQTPARTNVNLNTPTKFKIIDSPVKENMSPGRLLEFSPSNFAL